LPAQCRQCLACLTSDMRPSTGQRGPLGPRRGGSSILGAASRPAGGRLMAR